MFVIGVFLEQKPGATIGANSYYPTIRLNRKLHRAPRALKETAPAPQGNGVFAPSG